MRGAGFTIGRIFGIPIFLHSSWIFIFLLITYQFSAEFASPGVERGDTRAWALAVLASALFFGSVLFHELSHSVVAKHYRIPVASITLFFFGGIARITREPESAKQEFLIAAAGPASSYVLAGAFLGIAAVSPAGSPEKMLGVTLGTINAYLATFNLLPGFPLDGGRILRSIVWGFNKSYTKSTRIATRVGQAVGYGMIALGLWTAFTNRSSGDGMIDGLWLAFIGWFVLSSAKQSYAQVEVRGALEGLRVADIMTSETPTVARDISLEEYAREAARTGRRGHLVVADGQLVGLMTVGALQAVPREEWGMTSVQAAMLSRDRLPWAAPEEPALQLLDRMRSSNIDQMAVVASGNVVGLVTRDSILRVIETRTDLGHVAGR